MALEQKERQDIEDLKEEEKRNAEEEVYKTFAEMEEKKAAAAAPLSLPKPPKAKNTVKLPSSKNNKKYEDDDDDDDDDDEVDEVTTKGKEIWADSEVPEGGYDLDRDALDDDDIDEENGDGDDDGDEEEYDDTVYEDDDLDSAVPAPRAAIKSTFKYTPRLFKTPMRESTVQQERDFVAKNRPHLRTHGLLNKDALDVSDTDPQWLKGKGDDMFR